MLPNLLIIGAMKAGSTSLHRYLSDHPQAFMSRVKELDFFVEELNWGRGLAWYEQWFEGSEDALVRGESSTSYTKAPRYRGVPARIASITPDVKLIYLVRDPIERIRSQYLHEVSKAREPLPFARAVLENPIYVDTSRYAYQLDNYLKHFPVENLLVVTNDELRADRVGLMKRVYGFLGISIDHVPTQIDKEFNPTSSRRAMRRGEVLLRRVPGFSSAMRYTPLGLKSAVRRLTTRKMTRDAEATVVDERLRRELQDRLRDDVGLLRAYLGPDFDGWGIG